MRLNKLCLFILFMAGASAAQGATTHIDLELAARHDDNLSRAESGRDTFSDNVLNLGITATPAPSFRTVAKAIADDPAFGARHFRAEADGSHTSNDTELRASWLHRFR